MTIELLKKETPAFIDPSLWPPNSLLTTVFGAFSRKGFSATR